MLPQGRYICTNDEGHIMKITDTIEKHFKGKYKLPKGKLPKFLLYMLGWTFGVSFKFIKRNIGYPIALNNNKSKELLGLKYTNLDTTIVDMINSIK